MRFERQIILKEWGSAGQALLSTTRAGLPCEGEAFAVAERYLHAAGVSAVEHDAVCTQPRSLEAMIDALAWHSAPAKSVGVGAACAVDFLTTTLRGGER